METQAKVKLQNGGLVEIDTGLLVTPSRLCDYIIEAKRVQPSDAGVYNEAFLASTRTDIKETKKDFYVVLVPVPQTALQTQEQITSFIQTMAHTARRLKDCPNIIGFKLPAPLVQNKKALKDFKDALFQKHPHYVYL